MGLGELGWVLCLDGLIGPIAWDSCIYVDAWFHIRLIFRDLRLPLI